MQTVSMSYTVNKVHHTGELIKLGIIEVSETIKEKELFEILINQGFYDVSRDTDYKERLWFDGDIDRPKKEFHALGSRLYLVLEQKRKRTRNEQS